MEKAAMGQVSPSTSVSPANHYSTNFSIIIITRGWHNRPISGRSAEWIQMDPTPPLYQLKKIFMQLLMDMRVMLKSLLEIDFYRRGLSESDFF
jgi:hypothetical protein